MINFLYANGCSWTAGHGIQDHDSLQHMPVSERWNQIPVYAWPSVLAKNLNVQHINHAQVCLMSKNAPNELIEKAAKKAGSRALLAEKTGLCYSSVTHWANGTREVTRAGCIAIWNAVGIKCSELYVYPKRTKTA